MASLVKLHKIIKPLVSRNTGIIYTAVRTKVYTHNDFAPGPYPNTEQERKKAAEKYGLHPDEYEPYPDDGSGLGDYPKLPLNGHASRNTYLPWTDPICRRDIHDTYNKHEMIIGEDRWDAGVKPPVPYMFGVKAFFTVVGVITFVWWLYEPYKMHHPVMEKQFPKSGVVHYTFEPTR